MSRSATPAGRLAGFRPETRDGEFVRPPSQFRHWVTADGSPGPDGEGGFAAARGRYHLYVSHACPWCHRVMIVRALAGLEEAVTVSVSHPFMGERGWEFRPDFPGATGDPVNGIRFIRDLYHRVQPDYGGRYTVPLLWDRERQTIVNNESADLVRMLDEAFADPGADRAGLRPPAAREAIDRINAEVYENVNNGVYRAGFATRQAAYERAFDALFATLAALEQRLGSSRYLAGPRPTEADWRLFPTLVRFDAVYYGHFKCNLRRIADYPNLSNYLRDLYQQPGVAETVHMDHIKHHYYASHTGINPTGVVPRGPALDFEAPHDRDRSSLDP